MEGVKNTPKIVCSYGVALARVYDGRFQILVVRKRISYAYNTFVHGNYRPADTQGLSALFAGMTTHEKLLIYRAEYPAIWYHSRLNIQNTQAYWRQRLKFEQTLMRDSGIRLRRLLAAAGARDLVWEVPKGKPEMSEGDMECAIREFTEETRIPRSAYTIYPAQYTITHTDGNVTYVNKYHFAFTRHALTPRIDISDQQQIVEISDMRWVDLQESRVLDPSGRISRVARPLFRYLRNSIGVIPVLTHTR